VQHLYSPSKDGEIGVFYAGIINIVFIFGLLSFKKNRINIGKIQKEQCGR
jgi:hypothetical protein